MVGSPGGLDQLFGPGEGLVVFDAEAQECRVGRDGGGSVEVAAVGGPPKRDAQIGPLGGEPVVSLPLSGAIPQRHDVGLALCEVAGGGGAGPRGLAGGGGVFSRGTAGWAPPPKNSPPPGENGD